MDEIDVDGLSEQQKAALDALLRAEAIEPVWEDDVLFVARARVRAARRLAAAVRDGRSTAGVPADGGARAARWGARAVARFVDATVVGVPLWVLTRLASESDVFARDVFHRDRVFRRSYFTRDLRWWVVLALALLAGAYEVALVCRRGGTVGKAVMRIAVRPGDGPGRVPLRSALVRWLVPVGAVAIAAPFVPSTALTLTGGALSLIDIVAGTADPARRTVHDRLARTAVVDVAPRHARPLTGR